MVDTWQAVLHLYLYLMTNVLSLLNYLTMCFEKTKIKNFQVYICMWYVIYTYAYVCVTTEWTRETG